MYLHTYIYSIFPARSYAYKCGRPRKRVPIRECVHTRAHRRCRREQPLRDIEPRPSAPTAVVRRWPKAAHTWNNVVTDAVFHAPMFALNANVLANACEPSLTRSTPTERARTFRRRYRRARTHTRSRTHGRTRGRVCGAGMHRRSVPPCRYTHGYTYIHCSRI